MRLRFSPAQDYQVVSIADHLEPRCRHQVVERVVVGDALFQIESGIIASWFQNCGDARATELFPYRWDVVGQAPARVVLGKGSGLDSVKVALKNIGVQATDEEVTKVLTAVKEFSLGRKRLLTDEEFRAVAAASPGAKVAGTA